MKRIILIVFTIMIFSTKTFAVDFDNYIEKHNREVNNTYYEIERPIDDKCNEFMSDIEKLLYYG